MVSYGFWPEKLNKTGSRAISPVVFKISDVKQKTLLSKNKVFTFVIQKNLLND